MRVTVDQSPRIEVWTKPSFIGFSNSKQKAVMLPSTLKRECLAMLERKGKTEDTAKWMIFAAAIYLALHDDLHQIHSITIDRDFDKRTMDNLRHWLWQKIRTKEPQFELANISYSSITRADAAHHLVYDLFTGKTAVEKAVKLTSRQVLPLLK
ncbi:hypothetical protein HY009_00805 [Candidatus Acetothermia bacterium]|nr:hypothetical protein [Candidatus Acetothermia bacterium]